MSQAALDNGVERSWRVDLWVRRATVAAVLTLAAVVLGLGIALYAPKPGQDSGKAARESDIRSEMISQE